MIVTVVEYQRGGKAAARHNAAHHFEVQSAYVETLWLPTVGPTAYVVARRIDSTLAVAGAQGFQMDTDEWASALGVAGSVLIKAMDRLAMFRLGVFEGPVFTFSRWWPALTARQMERLPQSLQEWGRLEVGA